MLPLHKKYREYDLASKGKVPQLDDVIPLVRYRWGTSRMEGSAGLARMFLNKERLFVAYAWASRRRDNTLYWNYLIFDRPYEW